jgi:hypothetical protein
MYGNPSVDGDEKAVGFVVERTLGPSSITGVEVIINQTSAGDANFYLIGSNVTTDLGAPATNWYSQITETDGYGQVRVVRFQTDDPTYGIGGTQPKLFFRLYFSGGQDSCYYQFTVWTHDINEPQGAARESHRSYLWLAMDKTLPTITTFPSNGDAVSGTIVPCGRDYFEVDAWINDAQLTSTLAVHDSGISKVYLTIDNGTSWFYDGIWYNYVYDNQSVNMPPGQTWHLQEQAPPANYTVWNLPAGSHNLTARATDGVGNIYETVVYFTYTPPLKPSIFITPSSGTSALRSWFNSTSLKLESEQVVYKQKTLGTTVTVTGIHFGISVGVTVNITLPVPPYPSSGHGQYYGNMVEFTVSKTTTQPDGTFTTTFVFPQAPNGTYTVSVFSDPCNKTTTFEVSPEVIYKPDEIIGPALIEVIATGFTAQNLTTPSWLFMVPDALQSMNTQIDRWWFIDGNGTLQNWLNTYTAGVETVSTTLNWPWMQPGTYTVEIKHINGDKWTGLTWIKIPCCIGGNKITVLETLSSLITIRNYFEQLMPVITRIDNNVVTLNTTVGQMNTTLNDLKPVITRIDGNVTTLSTTIGQINTTIATFNLTTIAGDTATIKTSVGADLSGKVDSIQGNVTTIKTGVGDVQTQIPNLTTPIYIAVVFSIIAAIAAIACAFLVFRKIA